MHRSLEDLSILFRAFLTYISQFQSYGGAKKIGARSGFLTASATRTEENL